MKTVLLNSVKLMNITEGQEKAAASIMYATAFCALIRSGYIYRRENGIDGLPRLVITIGNAEYKCQEYLVQRLLKNTYVINPYEDTASHYDEIDELQELEAIHFDGLSQNKKRDKNQIETAESQEKTEEPEPEITLTEDKQAEIILNETEYFKIGSLLNIGLAITCAVFAAIVAVF